MFRVLSKTMSNIFHQGLRRSEFEYLSPMLTPSLQSYPLLSRSCCCCRWFSHHRRSPRSMVSHVTHHHNHSHKKSSLYKWVHWSSPTFQILNLDT